QGQHPSTGKRIPLGPDHAKLVPRRRSGAIRRRHYGSLAATHPLAKTIALRALLIREKLCEHAVGTGLTGDSTFAAPKRLSPARQAPCMLRLGLSRRGMVSADPGVNPRAPQGQALVL